MTQYINTTKEERKQMIQSHQSAIQEEKSKISVLECKIKEFEQKAKELCEENMEKLNRRSKVDRQIGSIKAKSTLLMLLGFLLIGAGVILYFKVNLVAAIAAAVVGVAAFVFGCVYRPKWKQFAREQSEAHKALEEYDRIQEGFNRDIADTKAEIKKHQLEIQSEESHIQEIKDYEKYEPYYKWVEQSKTGHIVVLVTGDTNFSDSAPQPAKEGKKYTRTASFVKGIEVYLNDMLYCRATPKNFKQQSGGFGIVQIEDEGTQKLQVCVTMAVGENVFQRISDPLPVKKSSRSNFVWYHASICSKGTTVFFEEYDDFETFRKATSLTIDDVLKYI